MQIFSFRVMWKSRYELLRPAPGKLLDAIRETKNNGPNGVGTPDEPLLHELASLVEPVARLEWLGPITNNAYK